MGQTLFYIIILIIVADFISERWLDYLNTTYWSDKLPPELEGIYDPENYRRSQLYLRTNQRFSLITSSLNFVIVILMITLGGFALIDNFVRQYTQNPILMALLFFGILGLGSSLISMPFSAYDTFVIEERFGFNRTTIKTFISDKIKGWILAVVIGGGLLTLVVWIYESTGMWFWIITWAAISTFTIIMTMFYSNLIVPLFNRQTPLEEGELRETIEDFSEKVGFRLKNIFVINGSKRSTKANAYFTGLGAKKRIVLYDTLINDHSVNELVAVLAHEIGHYKKRHTLTGTFLSIIQTGLLLFILSLFIGNPALSRALGAEQPSFHLSILTFGVLYTPISFVLGMVMNSISRKNEYTADNFAGVNFSAESLMSALKKLSVKNLSNLRPHPAYVFFYYSHPPLLKRIAALGKIENAADTASGAYSPAIKKASK